MLNYASEMVKAGKVGNGYTATLWLRCGWLRWRQQIHNRRKRQMTGYICPCIIVLHSSVETSAASYDLSWRLCACRLPCPTLCQWQSYCRQTASVAEDLCDRRSMVVRAQHGLVPSSDGSLTCTGTSRVAHKPEQTRRPESERPQTEGHIEVNN